MSTQVRRWIPVWALVSVILVALAPSRVRAGGFTIPLVGSRMVGQGAFGAHPDDASAIYHNPAGLILSDWMRIDLSGTGILTNTAYSRVDYPRLDDTEQFDTSMLPSGMCPAEGAEEGYDSAGYVLEACRRQEVMPESLFGTIPFAGWVYHPRFADVAFGLGVYSPHNATAAFPEDGAQRYSVIEGSITTIYFTPTVAFRPHPVVAVGAGVSVIRADAQYTRAYWIPDAFRTLNPDEVILDLDASGWAVGWDAGVLLYPGALLSALRGLEIGVSYVSRANLEFEGELRLRGVGTVLGGMFEEEFEEGQTITRSATAEFSIPDMLRMSLGYDFGEFAWVGADLYWNHYSLYDELTIRLDEPLGTLEEFTEPKDSFDAWSLAVGGRVSPIEPLDVRLGVFLDQSPYPDKTYTILSPDADKLGLTTGLSWRPGWGFELTGSYMLLLYQDRVVDNSIIRPVFTLESLNLEMAAPFSANGEVVDKIVHVFGLQLGWSWDRGEEQAREDDQAEPEYFYPDWAEGGREG